jgi:uncharacterized protein YxeA
MKKLALTLVALMVLVTVGVMIWDHLNPIKIPEVKKTSVVYVESTAEVAGEQDDVVYVVEFSLNPSFEKTEN